MPQPQGGVVFQAYHYHRFGVLKRKEALDHGVRTIDFKIFVTQENRVSVHLEECPHSEGVSEFCVSISKLRDRERRREN